MPLLQTSGNVTADGYGGGVAAVPNYIEECFSTYLYTGTGSARSITNGIDLSTYGGMTWFKCRSNAYDHGLFDTARGAGYRLISNTTDAQNFSTNYLSSFDSSGFSIGGGPTTTNYLNETYASWTFRKQPKFFDVVTYTGNGSSSQAVSHALGATPGCVIVKRTDSTSFWLVWHRGFSSPDVSYGYLNSTDPFQPDSPNNNWAAAPTSTTFTPAGNYNVNGATYVAYLFAHDAGGFGLTGTDNVISCGSVTADAGGNIPTVNLGWEPQWVLYKRVDSTSAWFLFDTMRGLVTASDPASTANQALYPNLSNAEAASGALFQPTATGFGADTAGANSSWIYIAIRRGPMKVPTSGTSVFAPFASSAASGTTLTTNFPVDSAWFDFRGGDTNNATVLDRLRGTPQTSTDTASNLFLRTSGTAAETTTTVAGFQWWNTGINIGPYYGGYSTAYWMFRRAPSFFDEVCYTGTGASLTLTHNLTVAPELVICKSRSTVDDWIVLGKFGATTFEYAFLNYTDPFSGAVAYSSTNQCSAKPTASSLFLGNQGGVNTSGTTYVAYLFATCAGVSKVGSYTGNGTTQTIDCGFTGGARFVLIKRTDSTGDWYVYDTARGMTVLTDPYLLLNSTAAESATLGSVTTVSTGFAVNASILAAINTNGASYIFLAIA